MTTIVLLPGMDGTGTLFDEFIAALGWKARVIAYPADRALDYRQLEMLVASQLPADEPYILLGESFSGPIAIRLAAKAPPKLAGLVLVCTFAKLRPAHAPGFLHRVVSRLPFCKLPISWGAAALLGSFDSPRMRTKLASAIASVSPSVWRIRLQSVMTVDVTQELKTIRMPIVYLQASDDKVVPARAGEWIRSTNAHTKLVTVPGPHALLQSNPTACAAAIRDSLGGHTHGSG